MLSNALDTLLSIMEISHRRSLSFQEKLQRILEEVVACMNTEYGSIMILRSKKSFEVAASTTAKLVGIRQQIEENTPSAWVVKNKQILYVGPGMDDRMFTKRYAHYKKDAFLIAPIFSNDKVIGMLSITDKKDVDEFSPDERDLLLAIAGQVIGAIENQRLADSLRKSRNDIKRKNVELKNLERIRTELFNMLIHDLKGPLSEMVANLDILSYTIKDDNIDFVQAAQSACDTLFRMISDLLDITRLEEGYLKLIYEQIEPVELVHEAVIRLNGMAKNRGIEIREGAPSGMNNKAFLGDRGIMLRVMQNLLVNAVQHSPQGSSVEAGFEQGHNQISFYVQDEGPGIAPEYQEAIFNKFFQITKKKDGRRYSTGLGLTFCKLAIQAHQGSIHVESDGKKGSRFILSIPASPGNMLRKPTKRKSIP
ncbi:MAG TPA: ATP-binding protein [Desulfomonilia bacterium]|nr:ATP-binding protein [Desulfomonilia bacterium]